MRGILRHLPRYTLRTLAIFLLLATCVGALWCYWEPWYIASVIEASELSQIDNVSLDQEGNTITVLGRSRLRSADGGLTRRDYRVRDGQLVNAVSVKAPSGNSSWIGPGRKLDIEGYDYEYCEGYTSHRLVIRDSSSNRILTRFDKGVRERDVALSQDGCTLAYAVWPRAIHVYRRARPEWWWGVFYLKEFWATAIFAAFFAWSIRRDRKYFRVLDERLAAALAEKAARAAVYAALAHSGGCEGGARRCPR